MKNILILALFGLSVATSRAADTNAAQLTPAFVKELRTNPVLRPAQSGAGDFAALQAIAAPDTSAPSPVSRP